MNELINTNRQIVSTVLHGPAMDGGRFTLLTVLLLLAIPLSGCTEQGPQSTKIESESLVEISNPCSLPSQSIQQSMISIDVNGVERYFRLTIPGTEAGTRLPVVLAFHGGDGAEEDFPQQAQFDELAEEQRFIMAYPIADSARTVSEGEWYLNSAATSRADNDFSEAIIDELSKAYCVDESRLYATGYSLGSMYTYEIACQLNTRFAAVASFAGTMPVSPESCDLDGRIAVMHIHGKLDFFISYHNDWDWKDGEHEGVGTMSNVPGLIDYWAEKSDCQNSYSHYHFEVEHIVHNECDGDIRVEHFGMEAGEHTWPQQVGGTETYVLIWEFVSQFTN
tara:strand:- start:182 stop:1189 length:1008 start_codon:yes stop_codon:yes gene_type:complete